MAFQRVDLVVAGEQAEALSEALAAFGAIATEVSDAFEGSAGEEPVFGEPGASAASWTRSRVRALFDEAADASAATREALSACGIEAIVSAPVERVEDDDWVRKTQRQFSPIQVSPRLWIVPGEHAPPPAPAIAILLDPGAAFGTGSHATTRLCLRWLESHVRPGDRVLDYGCGSGILAIAALKLGAAHAAAIDIDPLALEAARYNARRNGVALDIVEARRRLAFRASLTVANILANPLRMLAPVLAAHTDAGGLIALSGILEEQAPGVIAAYRPWAQLGVDACDEGWVLLAGKRG